MRHRLSLLMFLQYAIPGAWLPLFTLRLQELAFTPVEMGWACATQALGALVAPLVAGQVADRWFPAQRCLACCALLAGTFLWHLAGLTSPLAVFWCTLAFWLVMGPAIMLGTALCFTHLAAPERDFGPVRMWGTVGWAVSLWPLAYWFDNPAWLCGWVARLRPDRPVSELADAFRLAAVLSWVLAVYALTLPHTPPQRSRFRLAPVAALRLLRGRAFAVYFAGSLVVCITIPFTTQVTPLLLQHLGIPRPWLSLTLTVSQSMEIVSLALLPLILLRLGQRRTMLLGLTAWVAALAILTVGKPIGLVVGSLTLNGLCICCFVVAGQVFVNSRAHGDIRASVQALLTFTNGLGMLVGNLLVGWVRRGVNEQFAPTFAVGAVIAAALAFFFFCCFTSESVEGRPLETCGEATIAGAPAYEVVPVAIARSPTGQQ